MKISTFFYTFKQGIRSIFKNKWYSLASVATIGACLFLFGVFFAIIVNIQSIVKNAEEGVSVTVFFDEGLEDARIKEIGNLINSRPEVASERTTFVSAEEAWAGFRDEYLGEYADGFTENPLANSANYEIYLNDISQQDSLVEYLQSLEGVRRVNYSQVTASTLTGFNAMLTYVSAAIILILLAVSLFLISNTVTIGISVRKEEISIMKYIGATDFFVRAPFVFEGIIIGAVGAGIPLLIIYAIYNNVLNLLTTKFPALTGFLNFVSVGDVFSTLVPVSLIIGIGIGFFGSFTTVRKHLRV